MLVPPKGEMGSLLEMVLTRQGHCGVSEQLVSPSSSCGRMAVRDRKTPDVEAMFNSGDYENHPGVFR
jgi:hypothetical protein